MGNRAVITTKENFENNGVGVYLHWNGGIDSVEAFLKYCELKGYRTPSSDCYGWAYLVNTITNYFGDGMSVGIDTIDHLDIDNWDNGTYIIDGWTIVDRKFFDGKEQRNYNLTDMLLDINERQPKHIQLPEEFFTADCIATKELNIGDRFFYRDELRGIISIETVIGIGTDRWVNGHNVLGVPYMNRYGLEDPESNPNNYIFSEKVYVPKIGGDSCAESSN